MQGKALWYPQSIPQWQAILTRADETFYGGAAGSGKSDLALGLAIELHVSSIFFRREYSQLDGVIARSKEILEPVVQSGEAKYNHSHHAWQLPGGKSLKFGGCQHEKDKSNYRGRPYDLQAFDEGVDMPQSVYRFLAAWARSVLPHQRVRRLILSNPPSSAEGEWVIDYWAPWLNPDHPNPAMPGELRWFTVIAGKDREMDSSDPVMIDGEEIRPLSRTFIPARLSDNIYLTNTDYRATLQGLPEPLRSQLLYGDFSIKPQDDPWQVIPTAWIEASQQRWREIHEQHGGRPDMPLRGLGIDVARGGNDKTAIASMYANFVQVDAFAGESTPDGPSVVALTIPRYKAPFEGGRGVPVGVDTIGVGAAVYDGLRGMQIPAVSVNFAARTDKLDMSRTIKMGNVRAAAYCLLRDLLDPNYGYNIALPDNRDLRVELTAPRYRLATNGIMIEDKEAIKERLGRSPDLADAVAILLYSVYNRITAPVMV